MTCTEEAGYTGLTITFERHSANILRPLSVDFGKAESF